MTNSEFRINQGQILSEMRKSEDILFSEIRKSFDDITLPQPTQAFSVKLDELFEIFETDQKPLDQHLTIVLSLPYMIHHCENTVRNVQGYIFSVFDAINAQDNEKLQNLLELSSDAEAHWADLDQELLNLDFSKDLDKIIDLAGSLPKGLTKETAKMICAHELQVANYEPKHGPNMGQR